MSTEVNVENADFNALVHKHKDKVFNTCYGFVKNRADADDLAQDVFVEVYLSLKKFKGQSSLSTWIYRIAVNKSLDFLRKKSRAKRWGGLVQLTSKDTNDGQSNQLLHEETPELSLEQKERIRVLQQAIDKLPEKQKTAFILHKYEELSYKQIADIMKRTLPATESLLHRAKLNLRKWLEKYYVENELE